MYALGVKHRSQNCAGLVLGYASLSLDAIHEGIKKLAAAVKHQREVRTGYFDAVTTTIEANASTAALKGSTEDEQFMDGTHH
jgi:isocitrate lyase